MSSPVYHNQEQSAGKVKEMKYFLQSTLYSELDMDLNLAATHTCCFGLPVASPRSPAKGNVDSCLLLINLCISLEKKQTETS